MNNRFLNLVKFFFLETFKNKSEVFYTMFFPVIFLLLFGFIFGLGDTQHQEENFEYGLVFSSGYLSDTNQSSESAYDTVKAFFDPNKLDIYADNESLKNAVLSSKVDAGIIVDETSKVKVLYNSDPANMQKITWIKFAGENAIKRFLYGAKKDYLSLSSENIGTGRVESNQMDFLLTGIIAISILSGGMFSVINTFGRYKKLGVIKKFMVTPIKSNEFVIASSFNKILLNFFSIVIIIILGKVIYHMNYSFDWPMLIIVCLSSTLGMMAFGILLMVLFKELEVAQSAASILMTVMMFFAGIYFPINIIPGYIRWVSYILPIKYVADLLRHVAGVENMNITAFWLINIIMAASGIILLSLTSRQLMKDQARN